MMSDKQYIETIYKKYNQINTSPQKDAFYTIQFKHTKPNLIKLVAGVLLVLGVSLSLVYATKVTYQKVWKEPSSYTFLTEEKQKQQEEKKTTLVRIEVDRELAESCISDEEVRKIAQGILKKFDYEEVEIVTTNLMKHPMTEQIEWVITTNRNVGVRMDALTGELIALWTTTEGVDIVNNRSTKQEAIQTAKQLCEKYKPNQSQYELVKLNGNAEKEENVYIWYAEFQRKYGELFNPYEKISLAWIPNINKIYQFSIEQSPYDDNQLEIQKEQAVQIAKNEEEHLQEDLEIKQIETKLRIEKPSSKVLQKQTEEGTKQEDTSVLYYDPEESARLIWVVCIRYWSIIQQKMQSYSCYVDATTGEITGTYSYDYFAREKIVNNMRKED